MGENWQLLEHYFRKFDYLIAAAIIVFLIVWIRHHLKHKNIVVK